ncbi:GNAT family N-acetyltransferase [Deinococcus metallilatus]|uniref:GNAT family N-acetyltransferase n=1 Tax=Deinococcus metallilatus TaxID=1211322 RepID=A0AAJ5F160_9DEIO|nr:GNAT family N-acetyltransferase [Deinococcus metallilatus]MBB5296181.1 ribosomal protein S18 acetylase RimI-like enzyme [Deinococcus metallilatus]QBY09770.1 GNAT family N-acetyltransferase [Deinococcus metallilatus]RXJ08968.1 GNAT family N-acetyltransferase [Deinococcus metallilatus]TLK23653.1 GNAT family N-acetyltransferase [Deinococcus metallilatus]GMA14047.1 N-acetyltransferase [Deinococcus metallilatus]
MELPAGYTIRPAATADAATVARQRGQMFVDMGDLTLPEAAAQQALWTDWLRGAIPSGGYVGCLVETGGEIVAGVGMMFQPKMPSAKDPALLKAYVMNMYVAPEHRRRGLAEALMRAVLAEAEARGLRSVSLHAAPLGRRIYERLGFVEASNPEMRLTLEPSQ